MIPDALMWYFDSFTAFWRGPGHGMSHILLIALIVWFICNRKGRCGRRYRRGWGCGCRCGGCCCGHGGCDADHPHEKHHKKAEESDKED